MSQMISSHDALAPATAALAAARSLRARLSAAAFQLPIGALSRITQVLDGFGGSDGFTDAFLRDLGETITWCERAVAAGTRTDYETYDAWDREGRETTVFHPVQLLTAQARQLNSLVIDMKQLARLIERTIDLVAANAIVVSLSPWGCDVSTCPRRRE